MRSILMLCLLGSMAAHTAAATVVPAVNGPCGAQMNAVVERYAQDGFSGYVIVSRNDEVLLSCGAGFRNRANSLPNTPQTCFETGSLAKAFTALAVVLLSEDGKYDLHDPIRRYLPEVPESFQDVTIFHILTHRSGISRGGAGHGLDMKSAISEHLNDGPEFSPGSQFLYSNKAWALLAALVDRESGQSLEEFSHERIFKRAGMSSSGFCGEKIFKDELCAKGYDNATDPGRMPYLDPYEPLDAFGYEYRGMGGVVTTPEDLLHFSQVFLRGGLCSPRSLRLMTEEFRDNRSCGLEVFTFDEGIRCIAAGGSVKGYACKVWMFPDQKASIILLSNTSALKYRILNDLYAVLFQKELASYNPTSEKPTPPIVAKTDAEELKPLVGVWSSNFGVALRLAFESPKFTATLTPLANTEVAPSTTVDIAKEIISGLAKGTSEPLKSKLPERMRSWPKWPEQVLKIQWPEMVKAHGSFRSLTPLGIFEGPVDYAEEGTKWKYVALKLVFDRGETIALLTFNDANEMETINFDLNATLFATQSLPIQQTAAQRFEAGSPDSETVIFELSGDTLTIRSGSLVLPWRK